MIMANVMEEESTCPAQQRTIYSCRSASQESPCTFAVVRDSRIRVMQESEHDYRTKINLNNVREARKHFTDPVKFLRS